MQAEDNPDSCASTRVNTEDMVLLPNCMPIDDGTFVSYTKQFKMVSEMTFTLRYETNRAGIKVEAFLSSTALSMVKRMQTVNDDDDENRRYEHIFEFTRERGDKFCTIDVTEQPRIAPRPSPVFSMTIYVMPYQIVPSLTDANQLCTQV